MQIAYYAKPGDSKRHSEEGSGEGSSFNFKTPIYMYIILYGIYIIYQNSEHHCLALLRNRNSSCFSMLLLLLLCDSEKLKLFLLELYKHTRIIIPSSVRKVKSGAVLRALNLAIYFSSSSIISFVTVNQNL